MRPDVGRGRSRRGLACIISSPECNRRTGHGFGDWGDKTTLSPQTASMSSGVRLLTPRETGELSRGARVGGAPATGAGKQRIAAVPCCPLGAGGTLSWGRPSLSFLFPCTTPHQAQLGVVDATVPPPSPLRGLYRTRGNLLARPFIRPGPTDSPDHARHITHRAIHDLD